MRRIFLPAALILSLCRSIGAAALEPKPDAPYFAKFYVEAAPKPKAPALQKGSRLAICGDSITEQKMYSRILETYITVALPELRVSTRQFGWSGEQASGFLARMTNDVLRFKPTVATTCYGMNDHRYQPYKVDIGLTYASNIVRITHAFRSIGTKVIIGSPGCMGLTAPPWNWVRGTPEERNLSLCMLRNIDVEVSQVEGVGFADVFWPMFQAQFLAHRQWGDGYALAGKDSVHPNWAGHLVMAYAFLKALDVPGEIGHFDVDLKSGKAKVSAGHQLISSANGVVEIKSFRYPFCASGPTDRDDSIRSGMTLVPFNEELNRLILTVKNAKAKNYIVTWGASAREYSRGQLKHGINLAEDFPMNPFCEAFHKVDEAVAAKQAYETKQIKQLFHGDPGKVDMERTVAESEQERAALAQAINSAFVPVTHTITIKPEM